MTKHTALWISSLTLLAVASAGCVGEFSGTAGTGSVVFCVQDDPTVNFNGVFVNFGNIQINQQTTGNNTINDNDTTGDETMDTGATGATDTMTSVPANSTEAPATTTTEATMDTSTPTTQAPETQSTGGDVTTINVDDIDCGRVEAEGTFEGVFRGQAGGYPGETEGTGTTSAADDNGADGDCAPENPGCVADTQRGRSDSPCDRDQGFGNDQKCETVEVEADDVDVLQFKDRKAAFLAQASLEPGTIDDVCLTVEDVRVTTSDGEEVDVDIENGDICLTGPIEVREGQHTLVVFKVDVPNSFAQTGDTIVFNPVVRIQAAAPVTTTITVEETVTQTSAGATTETSNETMSDTMSPSDTMTTNSTEPATTTATETAAPTATNETSSPTPTTTGP